MIGYGRCPRCGRWAMEHLRTHSHCWECNYFPEEEPGFRIWNLLEFRLSTFASQRRNAEKLDLLGSQATQEFERPYHEERLLTDSARGIL